MTAATVTQLHGPRRATRLGPKEAREVVAALRRAGLPIRGAQRDLLALLLRVLDPREGFARSLPHHSQPATGTEGVLDQLGVCRRTLNGATDRLVRLELLIVRRGIGRDWTRYELQVGTILDHLSLAGENIPTPWQNHPVPHPELPTIERGRSCPSEGQKVPLSRAESAPQRGKKQAPNAGARIHARESDQVRPDPPTPGTVLDSPAERGDSPPAGGRGPLSSKRCPHGRTEAQGGCRQCGTTARDRARVAAATDKADRVARSKAEQADHRRRAAEDREAAPAAGRRGAARARDELRRTRDAAPTDDERGRS